MRYGYKVKTLYDGTENPPKDSCILLTENGRIVSIAPWSAEKELADSGCLIEDYSRSFAMPGMIDSHVHTVLPGDGTSAEDFFEKSTPGEILLTAARNLHTALQSGVTTLRDCGGPPEIVFELRRAVEKGIIPGPDLLLCGSSLTTTGGHTHFFGGEVDTPEQTVTKIRKLHKQGADFVKLIATGGGTRRVIQHAQMLSCARWKQPARKRTVWEKLPLPMSAPLPLPTPPYEAVWTWWSISYGPMRRIGLPWIFLWLRKWPGGKFPPASRPASSRFLLQNWSVQDVVYPGGTGRIRYALPL